MQSPVMQVAIRDVNVAQASSLPLLDALDDLGIRSVELELDRQLTVPAWKADDGSPVSLATPAERDLACHALKERAITVCAVLLMTDFPSVATDAHVQWAIDAVTVAHKLGVPAVRIDPLTANRELAADSVRKILVDSLRAILEATPGVPVDLAIENHGSIGNSRAFLDAVFEAVPHPRVGLALDPGNFYWFGTPLEAVYQIIEHYASRARHTHVKNINYPPGLACTQRAVGHDYRNACSPIDEGNLDYSRIIKILKKAGYARSLCIENESLGKFSQPQKLAVLKRDVKAVQRALQSA